MNICTGPELIIFYKALHERFGPQHWWPADSLFETIIGAILAQNVSWNGARQAVRTLGEAGLLEAEALYHAGPERIAPLIRSSRYYQQKAQKIQIFLEWFFSTYEGDFTRMTTEPTAEIREKLLNLKGFGPETIDSILLYALEKPVFVVDAYTRRIGSRQGWFGEGTSYAEMQDFFMNRLSPDVPLFNDFHAQIVHLGNQICKKSPVCDTCPVRIIHELPGCEYAKQMYHSAKPGDRS